MIYFVFFLLFSLVLPNQKSRHPAVQTPIKVEFCDLVRNPTQYESQEVEVRGTYRYAFEISELYCLECESQGRMWVSFDEEFKVPRRLGSFGGTFDVTFSGRFRGNGHFGHLNGSTSELKVNRVVRAKRLYKFGIAPDRLPPRIRAKVCGAQRARP